MALGSCYACIRYLMFAFNFIFWVLGCAILGVGIWLRVDEGAMEFVSHSSKLDSLYTLAYVMIVVGFIIMMVGFLGCCGAIRESQCMLATFFLALFIIFATLLGVGIWAVVAKGSFEDVVEEWLDEGVKKYHDDQDQRTFMDSVQTTFECCGSVEGAIDYGDKSNIPDSCHPDDEEKPCLNALAEWWQDKLVMVAGICIGIAIVMILGMIFSIVLCCAIRDTVA